MEMHFKKRKMNALELPDIPLTPVLLCFLTPFFLPQLYLHRDREAGAPGGKQGREVPLTAAAGGWPQRR